MINAAQTGGRVEARRYSSTKAVTQLGVTKRSHSRRGTRYSSASRRIVTRLVKADSPQLMAPLQPMPVLLIIARPDPQHLQLSSPNADSLVAVAAPASVVGRLLRPSSWRRRPRLPRFNVVPQLIDDLQIGHLSHHPGLGGAQARPTLGGVRVAQAGLVVPDLHADIQLVVQDPRPAFPVVLDRVEGPQRPAS